MTQSYAAIMKFVKDLRVLNPDGEFDAENEQTLSIKHITLKHLKLPTGYHYYIKQEAFINGKNKFMVIWQ